MSHHNSSPQGEDEPEDRRPSTFQDSPWAGLNFAAMSAQLMRGLMSNNGHTARSTPDASIQVGSNWLGGGNDSNFPTSNFYKISDAFGDHKGGTSNEDYIKGGTFDLGFPLAQSQHTGTALDGSKRDDTSPGGGYSPGSMKDDEAQSPSTNSGFLNSSTGSKHPGSEVWGGVGDIPKSTGDGTQPYIEKTSTSPGGLQGPGTTLISNTQGGDPKSLGGNINTDDSYIISLYRISPGLSNEEHEEQVEKIKREHGVSLKRVWENGHPSAHEEDIASIGYWYSARTLSPSTHDAGTHDDKEVQEETAADKSSGS